MLLNGRSDVPADRALSLLDNSRILAGIEVPPSFDTLEYLVTRSGLLVGLVNESFEFTHRSFMEFLAAQKFLDDGSVDLLASRGSDPAWLQVLVFSASLARPWERRQLVSKLLEDEASAPNSHRLRALAGILGTVSQVNADQKRQILQMLQQISPPQNLFDAQILWEAGPSSLSLLPRDGASILRSSGAYCVEVACRIGDQAGIDYLKDLLLQLEPAVWSRVLSGASEAFSAPHLAQLLGEEWPDSVALVTRDPAMAVWLISNGRANRAALKLSHLQTSWPDWLSGSIEFQGISLTLHSIPSRPVDPDVLMELPYAASLELLQVTETVWPVHISCSTLRRLTVEDVLSNTDLLSLITQSGDTLEELSIRNYPFASLEPLRACSLKSLCLDGAPYLESLDMLQEFGGLETCVIRRSVAKCSPGVSMPASLASIEFRDLPQLTAINLACCHGLRTVALSGSSIETLDVRSSRGTLRYLDLSDCLMPIDVSFLDQLSNCRVDVHDTDIIGGEGLRGSLLNEVLLYGNRIPNAVAKRLVEAGVSFHTA